MADSRIIVLFNGAEFKMPSRKLNPICFYSSTAVLLERQAPTEVTESLSPLLLVGLILVPAGWDHTRSPEPSYGGEEPVSKILIGIQHNITDSGNGIRFNPGSSFEKGFDRSIFQHYYELDVPKDSWPDSVPRPPNFFELFRAFFDAFDIVAGLEPDSRQYTSKGAVPEVDSVLEDLIPAIEEFLEEWSVWHWSVALREMLNPEIIEDYQEEVIIPALDVL